MSQSVAKATKKFKCPTKKTKDMDDNSCQPFTQLVPSMDSQTVTSDDMKPKPKDNCFVFSTANGKDIKISNDKIKSIANTLFSDLDLMDDQLVPQLIACESNDTSKGLDGSEDNETVPQIDEQNQCLMESKKRSCEPSMCGSSEKKKIKTTFN